MPSAWSLIDASFPTFTGEERVRDQCNVMLNYMFMLAEGLKYQLSNLNAQNFNSTALKDIQIETTADVEKQLEIIISDIDTLKNNVGSISTRLNALGEWSGSVDDILIEIDGILQEQEKALDSHDGSLKKLESVISADENGGAVIGKDGAEIRLVGKIYVNGTLLE